MNWTTLQYLLLRYGPMALSLLEDHWDGIWKVVKPLLLTSIANGTLEKDLKELLQFASTAPVLTAAAETPNLSLGDLVSGLSEVLAVPPPDLAARPDKKGGR